MENANQWVLDDRSTGDSSALNGQRWRLFTDTVMGGVSAGTLDIESVEGRACLRMRGDVRLENNGGFVQMALDLGEAQQALGDFAGIELDVYGNGETYNVHLRTEGMRYPWQSYRASFVAEPRWRTLRLAFNDFEPHRMDAALEPAKIRRLGLVAIGRAFEADLCLGKLGFYSSN